MTPEPANSNAPLRLLTVVIPARNEAKSIRATLRPLYTTLLEATVPHEIVVVDDGSDDGTEETLAELAQEIPTLRTETNAGPHGFGRAVICGLDAMHGDAVVIVMADASDAPADVLRYWELLQEGWDCVFGSRFIRGSRVVDYPWLKLLLNRWANLFIRVIFNIGLNDTTNAFKAYRREVIDGARPLIAPHFNLTVELPLKAIIRGFTWTVVPISWKNRTADKAKLKIKEMGSRYLFIVLYLWLEKYFSRGDYRVEKEHKAPEGQ